MADVAYAWPDWKSALKALEMIKDENLYFIETTSYRRFRWLL